MRTIGIDLAITGTHKAIMVDERGNASRYLPQPDGA
jgi:hypothetical protein